MRVKCTEHYKIQYTRRNIMYKNCHTYLNSEPIENIVQ